MSLHIITDGLLYGREALHVLHRVGRSYPSGEQHHAN
jgi:hypothetical protein